MLVAFRYALRPSGDLTTQHSRPRRKRPALAGAGSATGSSRVHNTSSTASCGACRFKSRAAAIFCWRVVELEAKLRPAGRRRVERGAAVQRCYKQAIAHGFGRQGSVHDGKMSNRSLVSFLASCPAQLESASGQIRARVSARARVLGPTRPVRAHRVEHFCGVNCVPHTSEA